MISEFYVKIRILSCFGRITRLNRITSSLLPPLDIQKAMKLIVEVASLLVSLFV
jgi:hypothetical protein